MGALNLFRVLGDVSHILSKVILVWAIHSNRNASGISAITQILYVFIFISRYLDLLWTPLFEGVFFYNFLVKVFYIASSIYIIFLMYRVFPRSRSSEIGESWRVGFYCLGFAAISAIPVTIIFEHLSSLFFSEVMWVFSIILESVCVLPQLILLCETAEPTVIDSYYLVALGSYRGLYILNWIYRFATERFFDPIAIIFGVIQTVVYIDFALAYVRRQQVKLRPDGGLVDGKDLSSSLIVGKLFAMFGRMNLRTARPRASADVDHGDHDDHVSGQHHSPSSPRGRDLESGLTDPNVFDADAEGNSEDEFDVHHGHNSGSENGGPTKGKTATHL